VERGPRRDGAPGQDAWLHANVLGESAGVLCVALLTPSWAQPTDLCHQPVKRAFQVLVCNLIFEGLGDFIISWAWPTTVGC
jgi:hypothetical protein